MNKKLILSLVVVAVVVVFAMVSYVIVSRQETLTIELVKEKYTSELMAIKGVAGVGIGECEEGKPCIKVYLENDSEELKRQIPSQIKGFKVDVEVTGPIEIPLPK